MLEWMALALTENQILSTLNWGGGGTFVTCCVHGGLKLSLVDGNGFAELVFLRSIDFDLDSKEKSFIH